MIRLEIIGRIGRDATTNNVNGKTVINFNVAHSEKYTDAQGQKQEKTTWVDCAYWTDRTAIAPYLLKGGQVFVEGTPEVRTYPKNDGTTGSSLTLRVGKVELLGGGNKEQQPTQEPSRQAAPKTTTEQRMQAVTEDLDDLPF